MTKTLIYLVIFIGLFLWTSGFELSFKPFSIALKDWKLGMGILFLTISLGFHAAHYVDKGRQEVIETMFKLSEKDK